MSPRAAFAASADDLALRVLKALHGTGDTVRLAWYVDSAPVPLEALGAVRVIGADAFIPQVLAGVPLPAEDAAAVARSFDAFPTPGTGSPDPDGRRAIAWRDWATVQLLTRFSEEATAHLGGTQPQGDGRLPDTVDWRRWSVRLAQLSPLAVPGLDSEVHKTVRGAALPLARGLTRAMLRRDFPTAVRLVRWLAWLRHEGIAPPLDPAPVLEHIVLMDGESPRRALDLAVARRLLEAQLPREQGW